MIAGLNDNFQRNRFMSLFGKQGINVFAHVGQSVAVFLCRSVSGPSSKIFDHFVHEEIKNICQLNHNDIKSLKLLRLRFKEGIQEYNAL